MALAMPERMLELITMIDGGTLLVAAAAWLAATVVTIGVVLLVVVTLPPTYFVTDAPARGAARGVCGRLWVVVRNLLGLGLILLGAVLSIPGIPGQGVLTMLVGVMLVDFPGRRRLERWLIRRPGVLATLNRLRAWWGKAPLLPPP